MSGAPAGTGTEISPRRRDLPKEAERSVEQLIKQSSSVRPVLDAIDVTDEDYDKHLPRYGFFAGVGEHQDESGQDTGCLWARGLDAGRYCGYNLFPNRTLIPWEEGVPVVDFGGHRQDIRGKYDTTIKFQAKIPDCVNVLRSPKECAEDVATMFKAWGFVLLDSLKGLKFEEAELIYETVLPVSYASYRGGTWKKQGILDGGEPNEEGTLENLLNYLHQNGAANIRQAKLSTYQKKLAKRTLSELVAACNLAFTHEKHVYDQCDADMQIRKDTGRGKRGPDSRDLRYSRDLHLPAPDMKRVAEITSYGDKVGEQMQTVMTGLTEAITTQQGGISEQVAAALLSTQQVLQQMAAQQQFMMDFIARSMPQGVAPNPQPSDAKI